MVGVDSNLINAVTFDFDGTLVWTNEKKIKAITRVFTSYGVQPLSEIETYRLSREELAHYIVKKNNTLPADGSRLVLEALNSEIEAIYQPSAVIHSAERTIKDLLSAGIPVGLVSANPEEMLEGYARMCFPAVLFSFMYGRPKTKLQSLQCIRSRFGDEIVHIGDGPDDLKACEELNVEFHLVGENPGLSAMFSRTNWDDLRRRLGID